MNSQTTLKRKQRLDLKGELNALQSRLNRRKAISKKALKEFGSRLSDDRSGFPEKKRPKKIRLEGKSTGGKSEIYAKLEKELRTPLKARIGGKTYVRSCTEGSVGAETLVRINIEKLALEAKEIGKKAMKEKSVELLIDLCLDPMGGFYRADFKDMLGNTMKGNGRAVQELIKQFFKDGPMMEKLKRDIKSEFYIEKYRAR